MRFFISISIVLLVSCTSPVEFNEDELIEKAVQKRIDDYVKKQLEECRQNAIFEADIYVDERIDKITRFSILEDSIQMISKPNRPDRPDYIKIQDSGPIKPFETNKSR